MFLAEGMVKLAQGRGGIESVGVSRGKGRDVFSRWERGVE